MLTEKEKLAAVRSSIYSRGVIESEHSRIRSIMSEEEGVSNADTRDSDILKATLNDMKYKSDQLDTVITKNTSSNPRVSELSIDMDDLTQLRLEASKLFSKDISEESDEDAPPTDRQQHITNQKVQSRDSNESASTSMYNSSGSARETLYLTSHELKLEAEGSEMLSFSSNYENNDVNEEMDDLNQMIESDNIRDLQSESMLMAEDFKINSSFLEDVSDLQPDSSERDRQDLHHMIHSDNVGDLQSETMVMAEKFKLKNGLLGSISDLEAGNSEIFEDDLKNDGFHTLDVSNATATSTNSATMVTENYNKGLTEPPDVVDRPSSKAISSTGESSGSCMLTLDINCGEKIEGDTNDQHAGEPTSDSQSPIKSNGDVVASQSSSNSNLLSINGWTPAQAMLGLLADVSDSASNSSRAESLTDSIASLEVISSPRHSGVKMGKDIETLLNHHGFDAGKVAAGIPSEGSSGEKSASSSTKLSATRQKKRELEARRLSIQRHQQKSSSHNSSSS